MSLPTKISPNPLVTSTVELRFDLKIDAQTLFPTVFKAFYNEFPEISKGSIPDEVKKMEPIMFKYHPDYILSNSDFSLSLSNYSLRFENIAEYPLWNSYFEFIKRNLKTFLDLDIISSINRIGLRYASIFEYNERKIEDMLTSLPSIGLHNAGEFLEYSTRITENEYKLLLQINRKHKIEKETEITGLFIDIDAYYKHQISPSDSNFICSTIDNLHNKEKELFFSLLKESFIKELEPKY